MEFLCDAHGDEPDSIRLGVDSTKVDGTERDWHDVSFIVSEPDGDEITEEHIEVTHRDYVKKEFSLDRVKRDLVEYFYELVEEDDKDHGQLRLAERGSCSESVVGGGPTCFPEVEH